MTNYVSNINGYQIGGDNFDGQFDINSITIAESYTYTSNTLTTFSLSSYLPNDSKDYECEFTFFANIAGGSPAKYEKVALISGTFNDISNISNTKLFYLNCTSTAGNSQGALIGGSARIPINASDRNITIYLEGTGTFNTTNWFVFSIKRKLGDNE